MKLLTTALVIILLTTTSAKSIRRRWRHDADVAGNDMKQIWLDGNGRFWWPNESSNNRDSSSESEESSESSESSESQSSEESSEEVLVTDQTTAPMTTAAMTTAAMTSVTMEEGSTVTPESGTSNTDKPNVTETMPIATSPGDVTHCVTEEIPTAFPVTETRGDN
ncbi:secretory calcium-binding phosphoprotein 8 [Xiphias gladius]|uniref:secretory calcium-binding phosphoprotein 8 n=1 Tax=Xiphias gladius TaxID=8245 RepID=UPI001A98B3D6|nr:secretory calcium-binding phosphoprotein 8 [Xiphias gladius]